MRAVTAAVLALGIAAPVIAQERVALTPVPNPAIRSEALKVCASGEKSRLFVHPADACWTAFTLSLAAHSYADAVQAVRTGCDKYRRGDHCTFLGDIEEQAGSFVPVTGGGDRAAFGRVLARTAARVNPVDVVDAEIGVDMRSLSATARSTQ